MKSLEFLYDKNPEIGKHCYIKKIKRNFSLIISLPRLIILEQRKHISNIKIKNLKIYDKDFY